MNLIDRLRFLFASKESQARIVMSQNMLGRPVSTPANYEGFARKGYSKNVVVYTAISKIATSAAGVGWLLYSKKGRGKNAEISEHPLLSLIDRPNPLQGTSSFMEAVFAYNRLTGNSYIEANSGVSDTGPPLELWPARPDRMKVVPGANGYISKYQFSNGGITREWDVDPVKLTSKIMHWKTFNPISEFYGMSPLEAAMLSMDQNNAGQRWNLALLQNSATPSGVLQMKVSDANPRGELTDEQYKRLKTEFEENHSSSVNAGRPMILEGGLGWQSIAMGPKDMDFINNKSTSATDIAVAYGVPPELMGFGKTTFNNYREARLAFYEETVLPLMDSFRDSLNNWLTPAFGENLMLDYDKDDIEALTWKREQKFTSLQAVDFLNQNEKREAAGYGEVDGLNLYVIGGNIYSEEELQNFDELTEPEPEPDPEPPKPEDEQPEDDPEPEDDENDDDDNEDEKILFKSINLLNANEKRKAWKRQNRLRNRLQKGFERDVKLDFNDLTERLGEAASKLDTRDDRVIEFALLNEITDWSKGFEKTLKKHTRFVLEDFGNSILEEGKSLGLDIEQKANLKYESFITEWIEQRTGEQIKTITSTSQKKIKRIVGEWTQTAITDGDNLPDLTKFIQSEFEELTAGRARTIARTEVATASNNGAREAVKSLNAPNMFKEWVTASDSRVRSDGGFADHSVMNGAEVSMDEKFGVPPDALMEGPGDAGAPPEQVINCRCVLVFKSKSQGEV